VKIKKLSKKHVAIITGVVAFVSVIGIASIKAQGAENPVINLREYTVKQGDIIVGVNGGGTLAFETVEYNFNEVVTIGEIFIKEGQSVKSGDKLASISGEFIDGKLEELNQSLAKANITLEQAKNSKNTTNLNNKKAWNSTVSDSKNQYENEKNQVATAIGKLENNLEKIKVEIESVEKRLGELSENDESDKSQIEQLKQKQIELNNEKVNIESQLNDENKNLENIELQRENKLEQEGKDKVLNDEINNSALRDADNLIKLAQIEVDKINSDIEKLRVLKEESILYAKCDGVVSSVGYTANAITTLDKPVVKIGNSSKILAKVTIGENDIVKIKDGQEVDLKISAFQDEVFSGKVNEISLKPNQQGTDNVYEVIISLDESEQQLVDGMTLEATFILKAVKDVVMISDKAIILKDGKQFVQIKNEDGTLKLVEISTGFSDGKYSEVISGLIAGDVVVIGG